MEINQINKSIFQTRLLNSVHRDKVCKNSGVLEQKPDDGIEDEKLRKACSDFEAIFLNQMFQSMKKTLSGDSMFGNSHQKDVYESLYYQEMSTKISRENGLGIGDALYRQLKEIANT